MDNAAWTTAYAAGYESASLSDDWHALTFTPGSAFAVGTETAALPNTGNIDAFGFYSDQVSQFANVRYSAFEVDGAAVPEPAAATPLGAAGLVLLQRRRRAAN